MGGVGGVRKSIDQSWLAKGLELGLSCWGLREFRKRFRRNRRALFKSGQWHFQQDNAPVHNSILVTDYLTKMGIKLVVHPPYSLDLAPCVFWLFPKLRACRYETIEEIKEAVTIGRVRNCLDAHLGQIVCDKDRVVDWCIVLLEMPLTRFEECWPLPAESLPELP